MSEFWSRKTLSTNVVRRVLERMGDEIEAEAEAGRALVVDLPSRFESIYLSLPSHRKPRGLTVEEFQAASEFLQDGDLAKMTRTLGVTAKTANNLVTKAVQAKMQEEEDDG